MNGGTRTRGFGLIELAIALVVAGMLIGGVYQVLVTNQRIENSRDSGSNWGRDSVQAALDVLVRDLREVSPSGGDLIALGESEVTFRATGAFGIACGVVAPEPATIRVAPEGPPFQGGDEVFVYDGADSAGTGRWVPASVEQVLEPGTCGEDEVRAQTLVLGGETPSSSPLDLNVGTFLRGWEEVSYYVEEEEEGSYLVRERSGQRTPLLGPLEPEAGFELGFFDREGEPTDDPTGVATTRITLRVRAGAEIRGRAARIDSLSTVVFLRN